MNLNSIIIFSEDPDKLVDYYKEVLEKEPDWSGGDFKGFMVGNGFLTIGPHDKVHGKNTQPERIIFNIETDDVQNEFERIKNISGSEVIAQPYHPGESQDMWLATLSDIDGNYFQLASPMNMQET